MKTADGTSDSASRLDAYGVHGAYNREDSVPLLFLGLRGELLGADTLMLGRVRPYDPRQWGEPHFARFRTETGTFVMWPFGTQYELADIGRPESGGRILVRPSVLLPGGIYAIGQAHRRDRQQRLFRRFQWTGRQFAPEGPDAERAAKLHIAAHGMPKLPDLNPTAKKKPAAPEHTDPNACPFHFCGDTGRRDSAGRLILAKIAPFHPDCWKQPWVGVPSRSGFGCDFLIETEDGGSCRIGSFEGSPEKGGRLVSIGIIGQVYCLGQSNQKDPRRSVRLNFFWDGDDFLPCDRQGNLLKAVETVRRSGSDEDHWV